MKRSGRQQGIISIMVTMIMMVVITLIVLGFAEVSRNEQRNSLDDALSTQAYYAAESGINDARTDILNKYIKNAQAAPDKPDCTINATDYPSVTGLVNASSNTSYTCLMVDASPTTLTYDISTSSTVIPIITNNSSIGTLVLTWTTAAGSSTGCYTNIADLHKNKVYFGAAAWACPYPIVRVDVVDANTSAAQPFSRATWDADTATIFFVPFDNGSIPNKVGFNGANGTAQAAACTATSCIAQIKNMGGKKYFMRVTTMYKTSARLALSSTPAGSIQFQGAQAVIDATGKAQDVLRRVVVAVDLTDANSVNVPSAAIISMDSVCKRFETAPDNLFIVPTDTDLNNATGSDNNPFCAASSNLGTYPPKP